MTDQILAGQLGHAREWAEWIVYADSQVEVDPDLKGAAEVILALPDPIVDGDRLREVIGRWDVLLADDDHEDMHGMLDDLRALLYVADTLDTTQEKE